MKKFVAEKQVNLRFKSRYRQFFISMLIMVLMSTAISLISPILINIWRQTDMGLSRERVLILIGVLIVATFLELALTILRERFAQTFNKLNFTDLLKRYFDLNYDFIQETGSAKLIIYMQEAVNTAYEYMTGSAIKIYASSITALVVLYITWTIRPWVSLVLLALIPINYFSYKHLNKLLAERSVELQKVSSSSYQRILSTVGEVDYIKQLSDRQPILGQLEPVIEDNYRVMADINIVAQGASTLIDRINYVIRTVLLLLLTFVSSTEGTGGSELVILILLIPSYSSAVSVITNSSLNKTRMQVAQNFIDEWSDQYEQDGTKELKDIQSITFKIPELMIGDRTLARSVQGEFHKGDVVWIQGPSGVGKSTLLKLLPKFRTTEQILFNGEDIRNFENQSIRRQVGYLSQTAPVVNASLRDNLFLGRTYDPEVEMAFLREPLMKSILENKSLDTVIEVGGANISGGEKQKIALTRMLQDQVSVLVLDEVTAGIDAPTAEEIWQRLKDEKQDKIIFIISHDELPEMIATQRIRLGSTM